MKQLAEKPFALLGVHGLAYEPKQLKAVMEKEKLNWRTFADRRIIAPKWIGYPGAKTIDSALDKLIQEAENANRTTK